MKHLAWLWLRRTFYSRSRCQRCEKGFLETNSSENRYKPLCRFLTYMQTIGFSIVLSTTIMILLIGSPSNIILIYWIWGALGVALFSLIGRAFVALFCYFTIILKNRRQKHRKNRKHNVKHINCPYFKDGEYKCDLCKNTVNEAKHDNYCTDWNGTNYENCDIYKRYS